MTEGIELSYDRQHKMRGHRGERKQRRVQKDKRTQTVRETEGQWQALVKPSSRRAFVDRGAEIIITVEGTVERPR